MMLLNFGSSVSRAGAYVRRAALLPAITLTPPSADTFRKEPSGNVLRGILLELRMASTWRSSVDTIGHICLAKAGATKPLMESCLPRPSSTYVGRRFGVELVTGMELNEQLMTWQNLQDVEVVGWRSLRLREVLDVHKCAECEIENCCSRAYSTRFV